MKCSISQCRNAAEKRGWCSAHYSRWKKTGDVQADVPLRPRFDLRAQVLGKVLRPSDPDGCWLWSAAVLPNGYGQVHAQRRTQLAHRVVFELMLGPIPTGMVLDHLCRNRNCVRPDHLDPITRAENTRRGFAARSAT